MLKQLHDLGLMTHMPFLTPDENDQPVLIFCQTDESRVWKVHYRQPDGKTARLVTGLAADVSECSPTAWRDADGWHVTFIAGGAKPDPLFHLYRMDGPALDAMGKPVIVRPTRAGFVYGGRTVEADLANLIHVRQPSGEFDIELPGAFIYRVAYRADRPGTLLISGQWQTEDDVFTLEYDLATDQQNVIECDGRPAYKCTILGDQLLYAQMVGEHFESRRIASALATSRRAVNTAVRRQPSQVEPIVTQPMGKCGCRGRSAPNGVAATRASCVECVEKHLGAAYVLLTETLDGYAHRLRAIGHLHEAEDESQEWQELHAAIREARKAYQADGTMPDWEALGRASDAVRTSTR